MIILNPGCASNLPDKNSFTYTWQVKLDIGSRYPVSMVSEPSQSVFSGAVSLNFYDPKTEQLIKSFPLSIVEYNQYPESDIYNTVAYWKILISYDIIDVIPYLFGNSSSNCSCTSVGRYSVMYNIIGSAIPDDKFEEYTYNAVEYIDVKAEPNSILEYIWPAYLPLPGPELPPPV